MCWINAYSSFFFYIQEMKETKWKCYYNVGRRCSWAEEMEAATPSKRGKAPRFERMMEELEEKLLQLRQDASILKRQLHAESKDRSKIPSWAKKILMWYPVFGVCKTWIWHDTV